jgi:hypothetical protein
MRSSLLPVLAVLCLGTAVLATSGCSRQGEGERCDLANGKSGSDSDCADGLVCTSGQQLGRSSDICCPENRASQELSCIPGTPPGTGGAGGTSGNGGNGGTAGNGGSGGTAGSGGNGGTAGSGGNGGTAGSGGHGGSGGSAGGMGGTGGN